MEHEGDELSNLKVVECKATCNRHDDWLHRGAALADLSWYVYMARVHRVRKPLKINADCKQPLFFDRHYSLSLLYCQQIQHSGQLAIPRMVGSIRPPQEENDEEAHAA